ncbi:hypothetical protein F2P79_001766, partial [Pimephales promelas]
MPFCSSSHRSVAPNLLTFKVLMKDLSGDRTSLCFMTWQDDRASGLTGKGRVDEQVGYYRLAIPLRWVDGYWVIQGQHGGGK